MSVVVEYRVCDEVRIDEYGDADSWQFDGGVLTIYGGDNGVASYNRGRVVAIRNVDN